MAISSLALAADLSEKVTIIKIYSIPGGASVSLDGMGTNYTTPCVLYLKFNRSNGEVIPHEFELQKVGYKKYNGVIRGPQDSIVEAHLVPLP